MEQSFPLASLHRYTISTQTHSFTGLHSWFSVFYGFEQACNDEYVPLYYQNVSIVLQIFQILPFHPLPFLIPGNVQYFICLHRFAFIRILHSWSHTGHSLCLLASFIALYAQRFIPPPLWLVVFIPLSRCATFTNWPTAGHPVCVYVLAIMK